MLATRALVAPRWWRSSPVRGAGGGGEVEVEVEVWVLEHPSVNARISPMATWCDIAAACTT
jgi:hypothetical protein